MQSRVHFYHLDLLFLRLSSSPLSRLSRRLIFSSFVSSLPLSLSLSVWYSSASGMAQGWKMGGSRSGRAHLHDMNIMERAGSLANSGLRERYLLNGEFKPTLTYGMYSAWSGPAPRRFQNIPGHIPFTSNTTSAKIR